MSTMKTPDSFSLDFSLELVSKEPDERCWDAITEEIGAPLDSHCDDFSTVAMAEAEDEAPAEKEEAKAFDTDGSGNIDLEEFKAMLFPGEERRKRTPVIMVNPSTAADALAVMTTKRRKKCVSAQKGRATQAMLYDKLQWRIASIFDKEARKEKRAPHMRVNTHTQVLKAALYLIERAEARTNCREL